MDVDITPARLRLFRVMVVMRPGIVAGPIAERLDAPAPRKPLAGETLGECVKARRAQHGGEPDPHRRLPGMAAATFEGGGRDPGTFRQELGIVLRHLPGCLERDGVVDAR
jgi:hypothetical protein